MALETLYENDYASGDAQSPAKQLRLVVNIHHPPAFAIVIQFIPIWFMVRICDSIPFKRLWHHYSIIFAEFLKHQSVTTTSVLSQSMSFLGSLGVGDGVFPPCYRWATVVLPAQFGEQVGDSCGIQFHSLHPHMESCKAGRNGVFKGGSFWISGGDRKKTGPPVF